MKQKKVWFERMTKPLICIGLALFLVSVAIPSGFIHAGGRVKPEMRLPEYYPYGFDGMGHIFSITRDEVVIDDEGFTLSPEVEYHTLDIEDASSAFFREGAFVGYLLRSESEIVSLWLLE